MNSQRTLLHNQVSEFFVPHLRIPVTGWIRISRSDYSSPSSVSPSGSLSPCRFLKLRSVRFVCNASSADGSSWASGDENPYEQRFCLRWVLGVSPIEGLDIIKASYTRKLKDAQRRGDEALVARLERAYDTIMMAQLKNHKKGLTFGSFQVSKDIKYADKQPIVPWFPRRRKPFSVIGTKRHSLSGNYATVPVRAKLGSPSLEYRKLGDSDLQISEVILGTMTFGEQNTEEEAHELLSYAFECGVNILDTAEAYPIPMKKETQGRTDLFIGSWLKSKPRDKVILATKICGYAERSSYIRKNAKVLRVDAATIKESVEKSLKRLGTDYIDLLQIHWPDRYVPLFGEFFYDYKKWRPSIPIVEQLMAFQELIKEGKVRYIGVSNETSYGVMEFVHTSKMEGLPKIISIQNSYSLLVRCKFEVNWTKATDGGSLRGAYGANGKISHSFRELHTFPQADLTEWQRNGAGDLVEVCHPNNCNIGLLAYSPLGGGSLSGKYLDMDSEAAKKGRLNLFPGYMQRYKSSLAMEATELYVQLAKRHGLTPTQLALGFVRDRPFMTSSIIGATSLEQLKEDLDVYALPRPLPPELMSGVEDIFKRYKDPSETGARMVP